MGLTAWETLKVVGAALENIGAEAEKYEDETGEKKQFTKTEIVEKVISIGTKLGAEVLD